METLYSHHVSHTGGKDEENDRKWREEDGASCFFNDLSRE